MELSELCREAGIDCPRYDGSIDICKIVSDSREACRGCLFVCVRGMHYDGHLFIREALGAGASAIVTEEDAQTVYDGDVLVITVPETRQSLACLFNAWYGSPSGKMKYIAVTGTNGKTSVTYMLKNIMESAGLSCGLFGTVSCLSHNRRLFSDNRDPLANMTTPDPEQLYKMLSEMVDDGVEYVIMEASSHALALGKLAPLHFEIAVFTNLSPEHLDFHKDMDGYLAAKKKLFAVCDKAIINADSEYANEIVSASSGQTVLCSAGHDCDYKAESIESWGTEGFEYLMRYRHCSVRMRCHIPGRFNVINSLEAAACAAELGIDAGVIAQATECFRGVPGRLERVDTGWNSSFSVFIDYAHTPDALDNLLSTVREFRHDGERVVVLFGCGGDRDHEKRPQMGRIAVQLADWVIITSDNSRTEDPEEIISDILTGVVGHENYEVITDRRQAITHAVLSANPGDIIILAGKGHENYEINRKGRFPFCEKEIVLSAIEQRNKQ